MNLILHARTYPPTYVASPAQPPSPLPGSTLTVHFEFVHGAGVVADGIAGNALIISIVVMRHRPYGHADIAFGEVQRVCGVPAQVHFILHPVNVAGLAVCTAV